MTFRDKSAYVTLNNANEEIMRTKYARSDPRNPDPKGDFARLARLEAEIDALQEQNARLLNRVCEIGLENSDLKAGNERLKADAERYRWIRTHGHTNWFRNWIGLPTDSANAEIDAARKDFSTTTKEEGEKA